MLIQKYFFCSIVKIQVNLLCLHQKLPVNKNNLRSQKNRNAKFGKSFREGVPLLSLNVTNYCRDLGR